MYDVKIVLRFNKHIFISIRSSFSDFASKFSKEERFRGIDKMRDKEDLFKDYIADLRRREKEESKNLKEKVWYLLFFMLQSCYWVD